MKNLRIRRSEWDNISKLRLYNTVNFKVLFLKYLQIHRLYSKHQCGPILTSEQEERALICMEKAMFKLRNMAQYQRGV